MSSTLAEASDIQADIQKYIQERDFGRALDLLSSARAADPDNIEFIYMSAVAARFDHQFEQAQSFLTDLLQRAPDIGRAHQEVGHLARDRGQAHQAISAYRQAVECNPALMASWQALSRVYEGAAKKHAEEQVVYLKTLPPAALHARQLLYEGRLGQAEDLCRAILQKQPQNVAVMRVLADVASRLGVMDDAEFLLESAVAFAPDDDLVRLDYVLVLRKRQKFAQAYEQAEYLHRKNPDHLSYKAQLAIEKMQLGDQGAAVDLFDQILQVAPHDPHTLTSKGHALKTVGDEMGAIASYQAAASAKPDHGDAYFSLSNLKTYKFSDDEVTQMTAQLERADLTRANQAYFHFALASAYEDRKDYGAAFQHLEAGNGIKRLQSRYRREQMTEEINAQITHCGPELFQQTGGAAAPDPIFIVGLPRAGSTLIEQILASHSQVDGTLELPNILSLAQSLRGRARMSGESAYPANLASLSAAQRQEMGAQFIADTQIHRGAAPFFTDKMPNNFRHIGLIHLILPQAKIIDARRDPLDCCFSGFKQLFAQGQEFSYGLAEIGQYYRDYVRLMDHWDRVLPGRVLRVQHEDVLDDLDGQVRRILNYLGLPFEEACVRFHETKRAVRTASSEQVRQPINRAGVGRWRPFAQYLGPLVDALGADLIQAEDYQFISENRV